MAQRVVASMRLEKPQRAAVSPGMARILPGNSEDAPRINPDDDGLDSKELQHVPDKLYY
jgi:hypothetical protein